VLGGAPAPNLGELTKIYQNPLQYMYVSASVLRLGSGGAMKLYWADNLREAMENTLEFKITVRSLIAVGSPVITVCLTVAEVVGNPIAVGPPGAAVGSPVSAVGSPVTAVGSPVTEIVGSPVTVGPPIVAFGSPVSAVGSPIAAGSPVTSGPPVIQIGVCNILLFYVAPDIWRNVYVKLVLCCMYGT